MEIFNKLPWDIKYKIYYYYLFNLCPTSKIMKEFWKNNNKVYWRLKDTCENCGKDIILRNFGTKKYNKVYWKFLLDGEADIICQKCHQTKAYL